MPDPLTVCIQKLFDIMAYIRSLASPIRISLHSPCSPSRSSCPAPVHVASPLNGSLLDWQVAADITGWEGKGRDSSFR